MDIKKYIIELEEMIVSTADGQMPLYKIKGFNTPTFDSVGVSKLTLYTEPDLDAVRKEAYDKGYQDAAVKIGSDEQKIAEKAYQRGLNAAWDAVKKLARMDTDTSESITGQFGLHNIMHNLTASEAIGKIRQYEQEQTKEAIPHKYLSAYWCECGWHLGKKGAVKFCADCGRRIKWD